MNTDRCTLFQRADGLVVWHVQDDDGEVVGCIDETGKRSRGKPIYAAVRFDNDAERRGTDWERLFEWVRKPPAGTKAYRMAIPAWVSVNVVAHSRHEAVALASDFANEFDGMTLDVGQDSLQAFLGMDTRRKPVVDNVEPIS